MSRVLLVDDEINVLQALRRLLTRAFIGQEMVVEIFDDPEAALQRASEVEFDVVVSDYRMPLMDGVTFLRCLRGIQPDATRLILSAATDFGALVTAVNEIGIFRYLSKPWDDGELISSIEAACRHRERVLEERSLTSMGRQARQEMSAAELEEIRLEAEEPGITRVRRTNDGSVILQDDET